MFGKRLMMLACMVAMTVGSVLAAAVGHLSPVIVGRSLQGFAAALIPIGISIMRDELPKEKVGSAVALMSATLGIGAALGLPLSGLIFENLGWQAIFWISAGIGVLLIIGVLSLVSESTVRTRGRFDYLGALLLSVALTALLLGISKGGSWGWGSQQVDRPVPDHRCGAGDLGALRAEDRTTTGRPANVCPPAGAADQHRVHPGRLCHVREPAAHHPTTPAAGIDRVRLRAAGHYGRVWRWFPPAWRWWCSPLYPVG